MRVMPCMRNLYVHLFLTRERYQTSADAAYDSWLMLERGRARGGGRCSRRWGRGGVSGCGLSGCGFNADMVDVCCRMPCPYVLCSPYTDCVQCLAFAVSLRNVIVCQEHSQEPTVATVVNMNLRNCVCNCWKHTLIHCCCHLRSVRVGECAAVEEGSSSFLGFFGWQTFLGASL